MDIEFYKYQGNGNDFILIDNRSLVLQHSKNQLFKDLCDRRFGIGADGLMLLENAQGYDFSMFYVNADGYPSSMCGNGGRCIAAFAKRLGIISDTASFIAIDGPHTAKISAHLVSLQMIDVEKVSSIGDDYLLNTGSPHFVRMSADLEHENVFNSGQFIRNSEPFKKEGVNVNFVEPEDAGYFVRTYERGVEDETLACGTGVTAVALAMADSQKLLGSYKTPIRTPGGNLTVSFERKEDGSFRSVFLEGPAEFVFKGSISV